MSEYILTFEKDGKTTSVRKLLNPALAERSKTWAAARQADKHGVRLIGCELIAGVSSKDFLKV